MEKKSPKDNTRKTTLSAAKVRALDHALEQVERLQAEAAISKQPRFSIDRRNVVQFFNQIYGATKEAIFNEPPYSVDSSRRDAWLAKVVKKEPYLLGVLQSVVSIDKSRGWTLVGGKIQVKKFVNILHNFQVSADLYGWRNGISVSAQNFYQSDLGSVVEIGRAFENGPLAGLYTVDPTKCRLTGSLETPLRYINSPRDKQNWTPNDYFRVASFPSPSEAMNGLGYCAVSRCMELAKLLVSVFEHDREKLGSKAPKGILTINGGLTLDQWLRSLEESTSDLKTLEREYYSGVQVLVGDQGANIEVSLTPLSSLPDQFDHRQFTDMIIYGYALAFGYDPREFWPVSSGALGTATESESQHRKASSKGGLDFALGFQEKLQDELPETLQFEFEQRDVDGDKSEVSLNQMRWDLIDGMYQSVNADGQTLITYEEARQLLVDAKLIPDSWTPYDEDVQVSDTDDMGALVEKARVVNALERFPQDDIVMFSESTGKFRTIRKAGEKKLLFQSVPRRTVKKKMISRAYSGDYPEVRAQYWDATYSIVKGYLSSSDRATSYKSAMSRNVVEAFTPVGELGYISGGGELPLEGEVNDWLTAAQSSELGNVDSLFSSLKLLRDEGDVDVEGEATRRAEGYANSLDGIYNTAAVWAIGKGMLTFDGDDGVHSCATCTKLKGQRHKASWWISHDYVPPHGAGLDCSAGGHCEHKLIDDDGNEVTL